MTTEKALDLALEVLELAQKGTLGWTVFIPDAITAIKQARSAPVQEPFGYLEIEDIESHSEYPHNCRSVNLWHEGGEEMVAIYTTPPAAQPTPVPLTYEQITAISKQVAEGGPEDSIDRFVRAIEAAHGITEKGQP